MKRCLWFSGKSGEEPEIKDKQCFKNSDILQLCPHWVEIVSLKSKVEVRQQKKKERVLKTNKQTHKTSPKHASFEFSNCFSRLGKGLAT